MASAKEVISKARSYIGCNYKHFCSSMGCGPTDWCAAFVSVVSRECGMSAPWDLSCTSQRDMWRSKGLWHEGVNGLKAGCYVYFDWKNDGYCYHVGIVSKASRSGITIIDGNSGDTGPDYLSTSVAERTLSSDDWEFQRITGYATPDYTGGVTYTASSATSDTVDTDSEATTAEPQRVNLDEYVNLLTDEVNKMMATKTRNMRYVEYTSRFYGSPFRFLDNTDPPIELGGSAGEASFREGRTYAKNISLEAPLVHFIPGVPSYLKDMSKADMTVFKEYVTSNTNRNDEVSQSVLDRIMSVEGRYFSFVPSYGEYTRYLNMLCRAAATYSGIGDKNVPGTTIKYKHYDYSAWQDGAISSDAPNIFGYTPDTQEQVATTKLEDLISSIGDLGEKLTDALKNVTKDIFGGSRSVKMYVDASMSFNESLSNDTGKSQISGLFDQGESLAKELHMWMGGGSTSKVVGDATAVLANSVNALADTVLKMIGMGSTQLSNLTDYATYIISGSNVIFPDLWTDSSYSKSYSISTTLISPYGDDESRFLYLIMPLMAILAMGMPRQTSANSFTSPMFVRVVSKGQYSCEMGIISDISIEKGGDGALSASGLPMSIKVNIGLKDLYSTISMPNTSQPGLFFNNNALIEFLAATCGVDMIEPNIKLKIDTFLSTVAHVVTDIPRNAYDYVVDSLNNVVMRFTGLYK